MYLKFKDDEISILEDDLLKIDNDELFLNNKGHWITVKPNGEENEGRHLFIKSGETVEQALERQFGRSKKSNPKKEEPKQEPPKETPQELHERLEREFKEAAAKAKAERLERAKRGEYFEEINDDLSNLKEVRESFRQFTGLRIGHVKKEHTKWVLNTFKALHNRFPSLVTKSGKSKLRGQVKSIESDTAYAEKVPNAYAYSRSLVGHIGICKDTAYSREQIYRDEQSGFHPKGTGEVESVLIHEIGHCLMPFSGRNTQVAEFVRDRYGVDYAYNVSRYATTNANEFLAEAFTDFVYNKSKARPESLLAMREAGKYSKVIKDMLKDL